ncbi:MAG: DeoR family transcriptional regulator [Clostridia bacterium]|jgi:DeoR family fructose operon transcriptional repressor|uniref:hypothetical protein n=1 Tax=Petroclostridium xylanilyticum TaxID=1792311 RepID=UPI000B98AA0E|nr:hypothetical protein [Petroclostridium xylanilyticum]MBZ4646435.1 DeoR family transcriptional regulator [Clostridia bacterium]
MIEVAKEIILLTDHTKVGKVSFGKFAELNEIDKCIVDDGVSQNIVKEMKKMGIEVHFVK